MENVNLRIIEDIELIKLAFKRASKAERSMKTLRFLADVGVSVEEGSELSTSQRMSVLEILAESSIVCEDIK